MLLRLRFASVLLQEIQVRVKLSELILCSLWFVRCGVGVYMCSIRCHPPSSVGLQIKKNYILGVIFIEGKLLISSPGNFLNVVVLYSQGRVYRFELDCNLMTLLLCWVLPANGSSLLSIK